MALLLCVNGKQVFFGWAVNVPFEGFILSAHSRDGVGRVFCPDENCLGAWNCAGRAGIAATGDRRHVAGASGSCM